jgi:hypothetical protein
MMNRCHRSGRRGATVPARFTKSGLIPCHSGLPLRNTALSMSVWDVLDCMPKDFL